VTGPVRRCVVATPLRDPNYYQVSLAECVAEQIGVAKNGYWANRWAQTPAELALMDVLRAEIAAGRITIGTHIVHLSPAIYLYKDVVLFSVYTGIDDDPYISDYKPDRAMAGGRIRPIEEVHALLAARPRPPYVVVHDQTAEGTKLAETYADLPDFAGYEELFNRDGVRLLRARPD
jgi:hypothetical protein